MKSWPSWPDYYRKKKQCQQLIWLSFVSGGFYVVAKLLGWLMPVTASWADPYVSLLLTGLFSLVFCPTLRPFEIRAGGG
jgi:heme A synthase